ncbi:TonB-dependent receptor [Flavobacterium rhizosphaerae]|uniref:Carboxypeptidase-like regulatory domain-containing protein n=1 Tax=Flavobacterium rhizosphaerae TaxID=3163298 RepID=A0ABW8YX00_9FLAO
MDNLESRTPYKFIYSDDTNLDAPRISLVKENVSIDEVLKDLQELTKLNFMRDGNNIAVNRKKEKKKGKITGKVVDETGFALPGATLFIEETGVTGISDNDGNYVLEAEPGTYTIQASFISYQTQQITGVKVTESDVTPLNISLKEDAQSLNEVVITYTYQKARATTEGMLLEQKNAAQLSDGISAEQIERTPDRDVGATLKRINGVTTIDERFVVVRSMGERWNQAILDGIPLPSTDPVQQQFNFELIPTAMVESVVVSKNATPDMYANFAGGYVEVRTRDIPKENFTTIQVGTSYNDRSTFNDRLTKQMGNTDYLGIDDGTRDYPADLENIPLPDNEAASGPYFEQSRRFTQDNFTTYKTNTAPGSSLQFGIGRVYEMDNNSRWGFVGSLIFRNTQEQLQIDHTERGTWMWNSSFAPEGEDGREYAVFEQYGFKNSGASYTYNSVLGGMFNTGIQWGDHKITLRNTLLHIYDNTLTQITGWNYYGDSQSDILNGTALPYTQEIDYPVYQTFLQNKIEGEHKFGKLEVKWYAAYSDVSKDTKDATFMNKLRTRVGDDVLVYQQIYNSSLNNLKRANFTNTEKDYNAAINFSYPFNFSESFTNNVKAGYFGTYKKATNRQESASLMVAGQGTNRADIYFPVSELLNGSYYNWGGFGWTRPTLYGNQYIGDVKIHSPFLMLDNKLGKFVRFVWGLRAESFLYTQIASQSDNELSFEAEQKDDVLWQYLPSANLTISPTSKTNLRLGYNKSVLRPQFAERLKIPYYDPVRSANVLNFTEGITSTIVENYDIKAEWFPTRGEILSAGVYKKKIKDPIEAITQIGSDGGSRSIYNINSHSAKLWGLEIELYKNLTFLGEGETLKNIYLYGNAAFNKTEVTGYVNFDGTGGLYEANRPLYGQSPYNYNIGMDYIGERLNLSIRQNGTGDQYILVGFDYNAEEIRMPYAITDAQIGYRFLPEKNLELRLGIKNMFDTPIEIYNNNNSYSKLLDVPIGTNPRSQRGLGAGATRHYDEGIDRLLFKAWSGRTIRLSLNYSF